MTEPNLDTPGIETLIAGLANRKWQGCQLKDLDAVDLKYVRRVARTGAVRYAITGLLHQRFWQNRRRLPQETRDNCSRPEAR